MATDITTLAIEVKNKQAVASMKEFNSTLDRGSFSAIQLAKDIAAIYAGSKLVQFAKNATSEFVKMEEAAFKFDVTFSRVADKAQKKAEELTDVYGLASVNAKSMLADTGDLLMGLGFAAEESLELAERTAKLGIDLKSFNNYWGTAADATFALTKAMLGETEAAKALGIAIKTDSAEYKRRYKDLVENKNMTEMQAKAYLALEMAYEQSGNAIGDYLRPGETLAQVQADLNEKWTQAKALVGEDLSPVVKEMGIIIRDVLKSFNELHPAARKTIVYGTALTAGAAALGGAIRATSAAVGALKKVKELKELTDAKSITTLGVETGAINTQTSAIIRQNSALVRNITLKGKGAAFPRGYSFSSHVIGSGIDTINLTSGGTAAPAAATATKAGLIGKTLGLGKGVISAAGIAASLPPLLIGVGAALAAFGPFFLQAWKDASDAKKEGEKLDKVLGTYRGFTSFKKAQEDMQKSYEEYQKSLDEATKKPPEILIETREKVKELNEQIQQEDARAAAMMDSMRNELTGLVKRQAELKREIEAESKALVYSPMPGAVNYSKVKELEQRKAELERTEQRIAEIEEETSAASSEYTSRREKLETERREQERKMRELEKEQEKAYQITRKNALDLMFDMSLDAAPDPQKTKLYNQRIRETWSEVYNSMNEDPQKAVKQLEDIRNMNQEITNIQQKGAEDLLKQLQMITQTSQQSIEANTIEARRLQSRMINQQQRVVAETSKKTAENTAKANQMLLQIYNTLRTISQNRQAFGLEEINYPNNF